MRAMEIPLNFGMERNEWGIFGGLVRLAARWSKIALSVVDNAPNLCISVGRRPTTTGSKFVGRWVR